MKSVIKDNGISLLLIGMVVIWALFQAQSLPEQIPSHFDLNGVPDKYSDKYFVLALLPLMSLLSLGVLTFLAKISPNGYQMPNSQKILRIFNFAVTVLLMALYVGMILESNKGGSFVSLVVPGLALFMIVTGNYFGKLERNFYIGIRLPWTLASKENWRQTHRFAGKVFVVGGLIAFGISLLHVPIWADFFVLLLVLLLSAGYSFVYFFRHERTLQ